MSDLYRPQSSAMISPLLHGTIIGECAEEAAVNRQFPIETAHMMALATASHAAGMSYCVAYPNGKRLPIGIYALGEQPPGTSKTSVMEYFLDGIYDALKDINESRIKIRKEILSSKEDKKGALTPFEEEELARNFIIQPPITDATPEALDKILTGQHGFFIANSTEQGLANSLIGGMYSEKGNNFDVLLKGFNAEWHSSSRVTRDGFSGKPHGGVLCISQDGLIETVLSNSHSTGLCERFFLILEGNMFGKRDHSKAGGKELKRVLFCNATKQICMTMKDNQSTDIDELKCLTIDPKAWQMIINQKQDIEKSLSDNEKYDASMFRGMWSKMDIQIMKVAATLHLYSGKDASKKISKSDIQVAIAVVKELLRGVVSICEQKGFIGKTVEEEEVEEYMSKNGRMGKSENEILKAVAKRKSFRQYGSNARPRAKEAFLSLVNRGVITGIHTGQTVRYRYSG